ncbi:MAG: hypothetical protein JKY45_09755, partial [Emcibacter sp.]|nr:hypothetical protein [Emcibacter sp.]
MKFRSKIRYIFLALIVTTFSFSQAEAQLWGKLKNAVKNKAEDVVKEEVNKKVSATSEKTKADEEKKKTVQNKKKSSSALAKANTPAQKSKNQK